MSSALVRYDAMCHAIAAAVAVDEVKNIRDKALQLETYARMARNFEAERQAIEIRRRAERKCGELLAAREMAKGAREPGTNRGMTRSDDTTASPKTLADLGISRDQSSEWQKLAAVPLEAFEQAMQEPSIAGMRSAIREVLVETLGDPPERSAVIELRRKPDATADALTDFAGAVRSIAVLAEPDMGKLAARVQSELIDWHLENCREAMARIGQFVTALEKEGQHAA